MKKRLFTLVLTGVMVLSLAACGAKEDKEASTSGKEGTESVESTISAETKEEKAEAAKEDKGDALRGWFHNQNRG